VLVEYITFQTDGQLVALWHYSCFRLRCECCDILFGVYTLIINENNAELDDFERGKWRVNF
jgi:hypothetical protein